MPGPASIPPGDGSSPAASVPDDGVPASLFASDDESTASHAAITLPREVVLARRRAHRLVRRLLRPPRLPLDRVGGIASRLSLALLALPPLLVLAAALWAAASGFGSLLQVLRLVVTLQFQQAADTFPSIDAAGRVLLASLGYFALLATLRQLTRGLLGRGWARISLLVGLLLALPSAWLFIAGVELAIGAPPLASVPADLVRLLVILLPLHAIILTVVGTRQSRMSRGPAVATPAAKVPESPDELEIWEIETERLPIVRFGPPVTEEPELAPGMMDTTDTTDTQAMRVAGLLHMLSESEPGSPPAEAAPDARPD